MESFQSSITQVFVSLAKIAEQCGYGYDRLKVINCLIRLFISSFGLKKCWFFPRKAQPVFEFFNLYLCKFFTWVLIAIYLKINRINRLFDSRKQFFIFLSGFSILLNFNNVGIYIIHTHTYFWSLHNLTVLADKISPKSDTVRRALCRRSTTKFLYICWDFYWTIFFLSDIIIVWNRSAAAYM